MMHKRKKIIFRADGNTETGLGHLYRLFALVEILNKDYDYVFITHEKSITSIFPKNYNVDLIPKHLNINNELDWISGHYSSSDYIFIADGYHFDSKYQKQAKTIGYILIYIDDMISQHMYADIVINHSPGLSSDNYEHEPYTRFALGPKFALMRPEFLEASKSQRKIDKINSVFICFGGADKHDLSLKALNTFLRFEQIQEIYIIVGGGYKHKQIFKVQKEFPERIRIKRNISGQELIKIMKSCHLALVPASTICYELFFVRTPVICGFFVENQKRFFKELSKLGLIYPFGDFLGTKDIDFTVKKALQSIEFFNQTLEKQNRYFNGESKENLKGLINSLDISFRNAIVDDVDLIYKWSNDKLVRKNSYNDNEIIYKDHVNWFTQKLKDPNSLFLIVRNRLKDIGLVRYERKDKNTTIGIMLDSDHRGKGFAKNILIFSSHEYFKLFDQPIFAYIKKGNEASKMSFEKAGYKYFGDDNINGYESYIYKLEK